MCNMASSVFHTKSFCIITGGSRGIGRAIAVAISVKFSAESVLVLTGRSTPDLIETQRQVQAVAPGVQVKVVTGDLANQATLSEICAELTRNVDPTDFEHALLINNAASLGDVSRYIKQLNTSDLDDIQQYYMLNLTSPLLLTSHYLTTFPKRDGFRRTVVNISSLSGIKPTSTCGLYCMGKAARDMMFKTVAAEEPDVRVLNYSPGPVDTVMYRELCTSADAGVRELMIGCETGNYLLKPHQTASVFTRLIEEDAYESGAHIDYFDVCKQDT